MYQNDAGISSTVPACRQGRIRRRRRGAAAYLPALIFAAAMLLPTPKARAVDSFVVRSAGTDGFCQISTVATTGGIELPEPLGRFHFDLGSSNFVEGLEIGKARLTGVAESGAGRFAVNLVVEDRLSKGDDGYADTCRQFFLSTLRCGDLPDGWRVYTSLSGTLTGVSGDVDGAVYNVSLGTPLPAPPTDPSSGDVEQCDGGLVTNPVFQVGFSANTHNRNLGGFAPLSLVLADPAAFPLLPASVDGEVSVDFIIVNQSFPSSPSPNLTGTWDGSIDCAGIVDFTDTETFSGPVVLRVGPQSESGFNYNVELSKEGVVLKTYCAEYANDLQANSNQGTGRMTNGDPPQPLAIVFLKARNNPGGPATLKARELTLLPDGLADDDLLPDGLNFCKWTFTQRNTGDQTVPFVCAP